MRAQSRLIATACSVVVLLVPAVVLAQGAPSAAPQVPGDTVPAWVFYWVLGLVSAGSVIWTLVTKMLWERGNNISGLSAEERNQLKLLFDWHNQRDEDQIPLWYTPRSWVILIKGLQNDHAAVRGLLTRIVEQGDGVNADLRQQLKDRLDMYDKQQSKMLKLAVRVQQAVEALAGLARPSIETTIDDDDVDADL